MADQRNRRRWCGAAHRPTELGRCAGHRLAAHKGVVGPELHDDARSAGGEAAVLTQRIQDGRARQHMVRLTEERQTVPYVWTHPDEER